MKKYRASAISGFFLQHDTVEGKAVYPTEMKYIFSLANSTQGVNDACIASFPNSDDQWQCNFAQHAYANTKSPTFPLNSALDHWQTVSHRSYLISNQSLFMLPQLPAAAPSKCNTWWS
jgi:hypothetical protein